MTRPDSQDRYLYDTFHMGRSCMDLYSNEVGAEFIHIKSFAAYVGGSPTNMSVGCRRLGLKSALLTAFGADPVGDFVAHFLDTEGVDTRFSPRKPDRNTSVVILGIKPPDKFPLVFYRDNCADMAISIDDVLAAPITKSRVFQFAGTNLTHEPSRSATLVAAELARRAGTTVVMDLDFRPGLWHDPLAYGAAIRYALLKRPRVIMIMVKAGAPVDEVIAQLKPQLSPGDMIIDGGNSRFPDTERRFRELESSGIHYLGVGVSGGEEGALRGPSIMPGGTRKAYTLIEPLFRAIAAKVEGDPCVAWIGPRGAGHFVKMVHNAIEYGDMQLIAEAYDLLHRGMGLSARELHEVFSKWNEGPLASYLIEITAKIFTVKDEETNEPLVEMILDQAEQKGTGRWTVQTALDLGMPIPTISAAIDARVISSYKIERNEAARVFPLPVTPLKGERNELIRTVGEALYAAKICSYAQGMALLHRASEEYDYALDYGEIARIWRGGCIIRARFLDDVREAFRERPDLANLLLAPFFREALLKGQQALRDIVSLSALAGIPLPGMSSSLAYFDSYRSPHLPANLTQAQRDYFGAHTYRRIDREGVFHTKWPL